MTNNSTATAALTDQDKTTIRIAAYGAITLLTAAGAAGNKPSKIAANGSIALGSATGMVGHVLADYPKTRDLNGKTVAAIADKVLPALTAAMTILKAQAPSEAANFRHTVITAIESAIHHGRPTPVMTDMIRKITAALDAA
jgi:hypothetical protein